MKPLSEQQLKQKVTDICFENGGVTKPMADKLTALILQDRQAWGFQERARELRMLLRAEYIKPDCYDIVTLAAEAVERKRNTPKEGV